MNLDKEFNDNVNAVDALADTILDLEKTIKQVEDVGFTTLQKNLQEQCDNLHNLHQQLQYMALTRVQDPAQTYADILKSAFFMQKYSKNIDTSE